METRNIKDLSVGQRIASYLDKNAESATEAQKKDVLLSSQKRLIRAEKLIKTGNNNYELSVISGQPNAQPFDGNILSDALSKLQIQPGELFFATHIAVYVAIRDCGAAIFSGTNPTRFSKGSLYQYMNQAIYAKLTSAGGSFESYDAVWSGTLDYKVETKSPLQSWEIADISYNAPRTQEKTVQILNATPALATNYQEVDSKKGRLEFCELEKFLVITEKSQSSFLLNFAKYGDDKLQATSGNTAAFIGIALKGVSLPGGSNFINKFPLA